MQGDPPAYEIKKAFAVLEYVWWWEVWNIHRVYRSECFRSALTWTQHTAWCDNCGRLWERIPGTYQAHWS